LIMRATSESPWVGMWQKLKLLLWGRVNKIAIKNLLVNYLKIYSRFKELRRKMFDAFFQDGFVTLKVIQRPFAVIAVKLSLKMFRENYAWLSWIFHLETRVNWEGFEKNSNPNLHNFRFRLKCITRNIVSY
jgi:hypothetical protein